MSALAPAPPFASGSHYTGPAEGESMPGPMPPGYDCPILVWMVALNREYTKEVRVVHFLPLRRIINYQQGV